MVKVPGLDGIEVNEIDGQQQRAHRGHQSNCRPAPPRLTEVEHHAYGGEAAETHRDQRQGRPVSGSGFDEMRRKMQTGGNGAQNIAGNPQWPAWLPPPSMEP